MKKHKVFEYLGNFYLRNGDIQNLIKSLQKQDDKASHKYIKVTYEVDEQLGLLLYGERLETDEEYENRIERARLTGQEGKYEKIVTARKILEKEGYTITRG
jgi:isochorismate synthase EntC